MSAAAQSQSPPPSSPRTLNDLPFLKRLAILLSRSLNTLNPNEVLAKTVFNLSKQHSLSSFTTAISAFGRFSSTQAEELYTVCQHQDLIDEAFQQPGHLHHDRTHDHSGHSAAQSAITILDHDVLEPDQPIANPGLSFNRDDDQSTGKQHVFKQPTHLARPSNLGLDKLAADKRRERDATATGNRSSNGSSSSSMLPPPKRIKYDEYDDAAQLDDQDQEFKSKCLRMHAADLHRDCLLINLMTSITGICDHLQFQPDRLRPTSVPGHPTLPLTQEVSRTSLALDLTHIEPRKLGRDQKVSSTRGTSGSNNEAVPIKTGAPSTDTGTG